MPLCGGGDTKGEKSEEHKKLEKQHEDLKKKSDSQAVEIDALKKQIKQKEQKAAAAATRTTVAGGISFTAVVTGDELEKISKMEDVSIFNIGGDVAPIEERENPVIITTKKDKLVSVIEAIQCAPEIVRDEPPVPDAAPPSVEKEVEKVEEEEKPEGEGEDGEKKEKKKEEEKPKICVPDQDLKAATDIDMGEWDGEVPITFQWIDEASPFSEYNDPAGTNWWCFQNVRKAPGKPKKVTLQWRQGMNGKWTDVETDANFTTSITVKPEKVEGSAYRGYQSRWVVDGDKYLSPLQLAPTLQSKLMTYPTVRSAIKALPADKQSIDNIPNENLRKALMTVENIIPMNTWDIDYGITKIPGAYLDEEQVLTVGEKLETIAKAKTNDPAIQSEVRKTILKSPIMAANAAAGTVGVKLDMIVQNMDFFLPKMSDPNFEQMLSIEEKQAQWETLRREMQTDVNGLYPTFQGGLRVTFPPTRVIENAMRTKRPDASPTIKIPTVVTFKLEDDKDYIEKHKVQFVYWRDDEADYSKKVVADLEGKEKTEKFGIKREEKPIWKKYSATLPLNHGVYRYYWLFDDKPYFNNGCPYKDFEPGTSYQTVSVMCKVQFGIGVQF